MSAPIRYLSVCSGIEAATRAWHPLGWQPVAFSEIEPFPSAVLAHHYPDVPNWGDMTRFKDSHSLSRNGDAVCGLSDILETGDVPQRYFLSAKACRGILRRAEKRGKALPPPLQCALAAVAGSGQTSTATGG